LRRISSSKDQTIAPPRLGKVGWNKWIIAIVLIGIVAISGLFTLIYYTSAQVETQPFSYNPSILQSGNFSSIILSNIDGPVTVKTWSQNGYLVNGTLTARGFGSSLSIFKLSNSTDNRVLSFNASFPVNPGFFFSQSYTASINVYLPISIRLDSIRASNVNGEVQIHDLNATTLNVNTVNGAVIVNCSYCLNVVVRSADGAISVTSLNPLTAGNYNLTSTNSSVSLTVPNTSSFKVTATVENGTVGSIQVLNLPGATSSEKYLSQSFGGGSASVNMSSVDGQITITGT